MQLNEKALIDWLLEDSKPDLRYLVLKNLLEKNENDDDLRRANSDRKEIGHIAKILSKQQEDGSYITKKILKDYGWKRAHSGYQPKYKANVWQAIFLAQLEADPEDDRIKALCDFILEHTYSSEYKTFGIHHERNGCPDFFPVPCLVSNMIWSLSKLGYYEDERVQDAIKWTLKYQRFDDGDFKTPKEYPYWGRKDRCYGKHSCHVGCTQALKAMTVIPESDFNDELIEFKEKAIDFVLLHKIFRRSRKPDKPIKPWYSILHFPTQYFDDMIGIIDSLNYFGIKHPAIEDTIEVVLAKRNENGRWLSEHTVTSSNSHTVFDKKGTESKWNTYRALKMMKEYDLVDN